MLKLTALNLYPIKGFPGISLPAAKLTSRGLEHDRRWMLIDESGTAVTQRDFAQLTQFKISLQAAGIKVAFPGRGEILIPFAEAPLSQSVNVQVWDSHCKAVLAGLSLDDWFSAILDKKLRLVYMPDGGDRPVKEAPDRQLGFADSNQHLLIGAASLADLNGRLETAIPMDRFRPNLVVEGAEAFAEDSWRKIEIGSAKFEFTKQCGRCMVTTIDQSSGEKGREPLATLNGYRKQVKNDKAKIVFGAYFNWDGAGQSKLEVGMEVKVLDGPVRS